MCAVMSHRPSEMVDVEPQADGRGSVYTPRSKSEYKRLKSQGQQIQMDVCGSCGQHAVVPENLDPPSASAGLCLSCGTSSNTKCATTTPRPTPPAPTK